MAARNLLIASDLDGTLFHCNTFPLWIRSSLWFSFTRGHFIIFVKIIFALIRRKIMKDSHLSFKKTISCIHYPVGCSEYFIKRAQPYLNNKLCSKLSAAINSGKYVVVATAAPGFYASPLINSVLECADVCASEWVGLEYKNNWAGEKASKLRELFPSSIYVYSVFYTDHEEDVPTMRLFNEVFVVGASKKTLLHLEKLAINHQEF